MEVEAVVEVGVVWVETGDPGTGGLAGPRTMLLLLLLLLLLVVVVMVVVEVFSAAVGAVAARRYSSAWVCAVDTLRERVAI